MSINIILNREWEHVTLNVVIGNYDHSYVALLDKVVVVKTKSIPQKINRYNISRLLYKITLQNMLELRYKYKNTYKWVPYKDI